MKKFIVLTMFKNNSVTINVDNITCFYPTGIKDQKTKIEMVNHASEDDYLIIGESYNEVFSKIMEVL